MFDEYARNLIQSIPELPGLNRDDCRRALSKALFFVVQSRLAAGTTLDSDELNRLFNETIADKLAISQIMLLLREGPLSTAEIAKTLGLTPSKVSKHLNASSKQRLVRYDESRKCFALA